MRALVLGGSGAAGRLIVARLRQQGATAHVASRDPARGDRVVDLAVPATIEAALVDVDVVVNAAGVEDARLVGTVTSHGIALVDITASTGYVAAVEALRPAAPVVLSVGLAPGLTNLLAAAVHQEAPGAIDLAIVLGAGERHGKAGVAWTYDLIGRSFSDPATGAPVRNFTHGKRFPIPGVGSRLLRRADFSDQHALTRDLGVAVRTYFGLDSRLAGLTLAALTRIPGGRRAPQGLRLPGSDRWTIVAQAEGGTSRWASGHGQSRATALIAVEAARVATAAAPGVHHLHQLMALADVPADVGVIGNGAIGNGSGRGMAGHVRRGHQKDRTARP